MLLLHLSDIHFRRGEVGTAMDPNAHLRNELLRDAAVQCQRIGQVPAAVLVSGDVAFAGDKAEYDYALRWLEDLCTRCGTALPAVFVIPGNHDVVRNIASRHLVQTIHRDIKATDQLFLEGALRSALTDVDSGTLLYEALGPYNDFAGQFFCDLKPPERTIAKRDLLLNDGSILRMSGFNSAFLSSALDRPGDLFVDPACFQLTREDNVQHLVMCHHPFSWLRQGNALEDYLNDIACLQLFGHEHTNRIHVGRDNIRVAASAAHPDRTENGWEPGYNLIQLNVDGVGDQRKLDVEIHVRVWQSRPGEFRAKTDRQRESFRQSIELPSWIAPEPDVPPSHQTSGGHAIEGDAQGVSDPARTDPMESLREISIRFFKLTLSQKSAIAGKLNLLEEEDANQPDFERFRRVFMRAKERGLIEQLDDEVKKAGRGR
ncbi:metallophosphoesterase [Sinorhizobium sp. BJ1]|uniref:metallophosphoesterase n=1 Tax=Sinorhizobium sp. BJ1 TaxID=2035455 RepID=UPI000BE836D4|nr:metallophosphoesterase [Sinorhizobium sp. BJ1]PDT81352.1 metallophosphoesterase [Sinorhizobium sp. BJ1]